MMEMNSDRTLGSLIVIMMGVPSVFVISKLRTILIKSGSLDTDILFKILPLVFVIIVFLISLGLTIKYWSKVKRVLKLVIFKLTTSDTL